MMKEEELPPDYDHNAVGTQEVLPTAPTVQNDEFTSNRPASVSFPPLTSAEIKRACHFYAAERCCHGSKFIDAMTMTERSDRIAYHYTLESFGEKRETAESLAPYYGGPLDGAECGVAPEPWNVPVLPSKEFQNQKKIVDVPHTSYLKNCGKCNGKGHTTCLWCFGRGGKGCLLCMDKTRRPCNYCYISGRRCLFCSGHGTQLCKTCEGQGKLRAYKILIVTWINHTEDFVTDTINLPPEKVTKNAQGTKILVEENQQLSPLWDVPIPSIEAASKDLINKHKLQYQNEVIRKQRHTLDAIPFTQVKYRWKEEIGEFYVYGLQKTAYFDNYPQHCCCCCTIA